MTFSSIINAVARIVVMVCGRIRVDSFNGKARSNGAPIYYGEITEEERTFR